MDAILHRRAPSALERFTANPLLFLAQCAYALSERWTPHPPPPSNPVRVVCISDTHSSHDTLPALPAGDILIHAGDLTHSGTLPELHAALAWLSRQPHPHKIFIGGNHDAGLADPAVLIELLAQFPALTYLEESSTTLSVRGRDVVVYGSPWTPKHGAGAFQYPRADGGARWARVPAGTDVLVTHGPPACHRDRGSGCAGLLAALWVVRPLLHVCGHIHAARGIAYLAWTPAQAAYERAASGRGGWLDIVRILLGTRPRGGGTSLVNAACVGGFRDEHLRGALVVEI
jgi:hypothetical protein